MEIKNDSKEKVKLVSIRLNDDTHRKLKVYVAKNDTSIQQLFMKFLETVLDKEEEA